MASEIATRPAMNETSLRHDRYHVPLLPGADLQHQDGIRRENARHAARQSAVGVETVTPARQRQMRVMLANLARQVGDLALRNVGRVGDDEIEPPVQRPGPIALAKARARCDAVPDGIVARGGAGFGRKVDAQTVRSPALAEQRDQQAAGAGAEIEDGQRILPARAERPQRGLDDGLTVGTRLQRRRRQAKGQAPEFALADDAPDRLAGEAARAELIKALPRRILCRGALKSGLGEPARIDSRRFDASLAQTRRQVAARGDFSRILLREGRALWA